MKKEVKELKEMKEVNKDKEINKSSELDKLKKESNQEDKGSSSMFDLEENPWGDDDYFGDNPYPHFG